jgi:hypothetical protein
MTHRKRMYKKDKVIQEITTKNAPNGLCTRKGHGLWVLKTITYTVKAKATKNSIKILLSEMFKDQMDKKMAIGSERLP